MKTPNILAYIEEVRKIFAARVRLPNGPELEHLEDDFVDACDPLWNNMTEEEHKYLRSLPESAYD